MEAFVLRTEVYNSNQLTLGADDDGTKLCVERISFFVDSTFLYAMKPQASELSHQDQLLSNWISTSCQSQSPQDDSTLS